MRSRSFETRSLPSLLAATHRGFTFYVAFPKSSIRALGLPIYVARVPSAPFTSRAFNIRTGWQVSDWQGWESPWIHRGPAEGRNEVSLFSAFSLAKEHQVNENA